MEIILKLLLCVLLCFVSCTSSISIDEDETKNEKGRLFKEQIIKLVNQYNINLLAVEDGDKLVVYIKFDESSFVGDKYIKDDKGIYDLTLLKSVYYDTFIRLQY